jgi:2-haloacid dehalogenase
VSVRRTPAAPGLRAVVFALGGAYIDRDLRYLYRRLFDGDETAMERFLAEACSSRSLP